MAKYKDTYKSLQSELQEILDWFEGEEVGVDKAAEKYERGMQLVRELEAYLKDTEVTIEKIKKAYKTKGL